MYAAGNVPVVRRDSGGRQVYISFLSPLSVHRHLLDLLGSLELSPTCLHSHTQQLQETSGADSHLHRYFPTLTKE